MSEKIIIFDTTLRDGEQSPGASLNLREKLEIAHQLSRLKVDVIEAGFPISSQGDFESVKAVADEVQGPIICGLARAKELDIKRCAEALKNSAKPRIHTFIATSAVHVEKKLRMTKEKVLKIATDAVAYARTFVDDVEFSPEDAARTDVKYMAEVVEAAITAGATTINIPDTVGYSNPWQFAEIIKYLKEHVANIDQAIISVHCHNDLGLSVANSLAAIRVGARQVECTINGLGERAGNASLEEIVMNLETRKDFYQLETGINSRELYKTSKLVSRTTGIRVQPNKAIVGENAFAHEAGIHQDGMLKDRLTYEIMTPESVGWTGESMVLGKHSGRHAFRKHLEELGFESISEDMVNVAFERFKDLADKKKKVFDEDIMAIIEDASFNGKETYALDYVHVISGSSTIPTATVRIIKDGEPLQDAANGDGPVDAIYKAIERLTSIKLKLDNYEVSSVTEGKDALGHVTIRVLHENRFITGKGTSTDILVASAKAYLNAINKISRLEERQTTREP